MSAIVGHASMSDVLRRRTVQPYYRRGWTQVPLDWEVKLPQYGNRWRRVYSTDGSNAPTCYVRIGDDWFTLSFAGFDGTDKLGKI